MTYLVALVDLIDSVMARFSDFDRESYRPLELAALIAIAFPFTLVKRLSALGFVSWVAVVSCFFIAFSLFGLYIKASSDGSTHSGARAFELSGSIFYVLPLQAFNFAYHYIWFETVNEVSNRSDGSVRKVKILQVVYREYSSLTVTFLRSLALIPSWQYTHAMCLQESLVT